jgi:hypothetical protein
MIVDFAPSQNSPFQFQATLDGVAHTIRVTWNLFGERYYVNCFTQTGARVFTLPLIGSPEGYDINLAAGYFTRSTLVYRAPNRQFEVMP